MSESKRFGPVQVKFNDDGTLAIYQPDSNRVLSAELAQALVVWLNDNGSGNLIHPGLESDYYAQQSTVGGGVITTSDGPVEYPDLTDTEREADKNAQDARVKLDEMTAAAEADGSAETVAEFVDTRPAPPVKRRPGRPRKQP